VTTIARIVQRSPEGRVRTWPVTTDDVLWVARTLIAEDGQYDDANEGYHVGRVMTSMLVRRLAIQFHAGPFTSVTHLLRGNPNGGNPKGWSQPIRYYGLFHDSAEMKARYLRHQSRAWNDIPEYYRRAAFDTLSGRVSLVAPHVVDAAAPEFTRRRLEDPNVGGREGWRREQHGTRSWLISTTKSRAWPETSVVGASGVERVAGYIAAGGALLALLAVAAKGGAA
jgi:hypothetical protein